MPSETSAVNAAYIEARMKQFKLVDMREQYQELIRVASEQSMTYEDFLIMLLQAEETGKKRRQAERLTDAANFDSDKRLSDIDYRFNPNLDADKIQSLGRLEFMDNHENIIIIGPPGVGKSMIATGRMDQHRGQDVDSVLGAGTLFSYGTCDLSGKRKSIAG